MQDRSAVTTYLFTDIEGSARLWETDPTKMRPALASHDAIVREAVQGNRGRVVKMSGDGVHAAFADPLDAVYATLALQRALTNLSITQGIALQVRCGMHAGVDERRDDDFFGSAVNRAARIMSVAHGGQMLLSQAVASLIGDRLPAGVSLRDLGTVRLRSLAAPERVYQVLHPELRQDFPALRSLETRPNNLPLQVSSFVGRERQLADVKEQLDNTRLLTLLGIGGLGKTRLALQVAADVLDRHADGIWFVDFAPITDERLVPQAVASVLGVKEEAGRPVIEALIKHMQDRSLLLILDNCEHLLGACSDLTNQLLQAGPHLKILATSREHLHVKGETVCPVLALSVPDAQTSISVEAVIQCEAVRLFVDRARAVQPTFGVNETNAGAVADICQRLDGIPLALELAAARVRSLSVDQISARLSDRFRLLTRGERTALPRQRTLRASIDWSYDLLSDNERALLRRLAVFAGGWTLEAAEAAGSDDGVQKEDVLDLLTNLVEKSLVVLDAVGERYRLLETVREYAQERLGESGEESQARLRHLAFYLDVVETARPELVGSQQGRWLEQLDLERENILVAHSWCARAEGGSELGLRLIHATKPFWLNRGLLGLGLRVTVEALGRTRSESRSLLHCRGLFTAGQLSYFMGRYFEAQRFLEESLAVARELGDKGRVAMVLQPLGMACLGQADVSAARRHLEEALDLAQQLGNKRELAAARNALAQLHRVEGKLDTAEPLYENVLALARDLGDRESIAIGLLNLAMVSIGRGDGHRAQESLLRVLEIAEETGSKPVWQSVLEVSAGLAVLQKEWRSAARFFGASESLTGATGLHRDPADEAFLLPLIAKAQQSLGTEVFTAAETGGRAISYAAALLEASEWLRARPTIAGS